MKHPSVSPWVAAFATFATMALACTPKVTEGTGGSGGGAQTGVTSATTGSGVTVATTSTTGATTTTSTTTGSSMCPNNCVDGNPCTDGTCNGGCQQAVKAAGSPGNANEGGCPGVCESDGACGLRLYSRTFPTAAAWMAQPLSTVWMGSNAPPPRGILAAEHAYQGDRLFVWADDGNFYEQKGGAWLTPVATATKWPGLGPKNISSSAMWQPQANNATMSLLITTTGTTPRQAFSYDVAPTGAITPSPSNPQSIGSALPSGPPQDTVDMDWSFPLQTAYLGTPQWVVFWQHVGTKVYEYDGGSNTYLGSWDDAQSPLWQGGGTTPAPDSVTAAYYYQGSVYLVAP